MVTGEISAWRQLERAMARLDAEQRRLAQSVAGFRDNLTTLRTGIDRLESTVGQYQDRLETVQSQAGTLGAKSRKLAKTMDGYLARHGGAVIAPAPAADTTTERGSRAA
ncbi:MAG: hypothetical protein WCO00_00960 [Rhodospirillaceae bacterium]